MMTFVVATLLLLGALLHTAANAVPTPCEMQAMIDHIDDTLAVWDAGPPQLQTNLAKIVRLSFHDCVGGCDGAVAMDNPANQGLQIVLDDLQDVVTSLQALTVFPLNRADAWALIEQRTVHFTSSKFGQGAQQGHLPYLEYSVGRNVSTAQSIHFEGDADDDEGNFPAGVHNFDQVKAVMEPFGFSDREITVLLGAHTLGNANPINSGYAGNWVPDSRRFNNEYYKAILDPSMGWGMERITSNMGERWQWTAFHRNGPPKLMMLDADMGLYLDFEPGETGRVDCQWAIQQANGCPLNANTASIVQELANDNGMFLQEFGPVFTKMLHHGYVQGDLTHVKPVWSQWQPWERLGNGECRSERVCVGDVGYGGCGQGERTVVAPCNDLPVLNDDEGAIQIIDGALTCPATRTLSPTAAETSTPTLMALSSQQPTKVPTAAPTSQPSTLPTTVMPTSSPGTKDPTRKPSLAPTASPTFSDVTPKPSLVPTASPTEIHICVDNGEHCQQHGDCCSRHCNKKRGTCSKRRG